ncbi:MAG: GGDEF domain-containing protein [Pseudomonadota bacterium]
MIFDYHPKLIENMVQETFKTVLVLIPLSLIFVWIFIDFIPTSYALTWLTIQFIYIYLRYLNSKKMREYLVNSDKNTLKRQVKFFLVLSIFSALWWDIGIILGLSYAPAFYEYITAIFVMGIVAGAILSLSQIFYVYVIYFLILVIPQVIIFSQYNDKPHFIVLILSLIYLPYIFIISKSVYQRLLDKVKSQETLEKAVKQLHKLSITDPLTSINNRRFFLQTSQQLLAVSKRENTPISLLMLDIDYFKSINDNYGHKFGDFILIELSKVLKKTIRESDVLARLGGEEFGFLLYKTDIKNALRFAEKIRLLIEKHVFSNKDVVTNITLSIGVSEINQKINTLDLLYHEADLKLYEAKRFGRNRVC